MFAMGALSCAVFSQQAQAGQISGTIRFVGGVRFDHDNLGSATHVSFWFDVDNNVHHSTVVVPQGDFVSVPWGTQADMAQPWIFHHLHPLQLYGVFGVLMFDLTSATVVNRSNFFLNIRGQGTVSGNGFTDTAGTFSFTVANSDGRPQSIFGFAAEFSAFSPATDFDHNGKPDYVLSNGGTRQTLVYYMNNNIFLEGLLGPPLPAGWNLIDVADFNSDGNPDYLLFKPSTRQSAIWYLTGTTFLSSAYGPTIASGYQLTGVADFNEDGYPDYVLYNASTHKTAVWYMNNNLFVSGAYGPTLPAGWSLAGVADFDGDGPLDYLLFKPSPRQSAVWYLGGTTFLSNAYGPTLPSGWTLTGTGDFNSDGKPDYVLFRPSTRQTAIWYLNGTVFVSSAVGPTLPSGWELVSP